MSHNVAIDGPAGAGKSTIAKRIARRLGYKDKLQIANLCRRT